MNRGGLVAILVVLGAGLARADSIVAVRTLAARHVLSAEDVTLVAAEIPGAATDMSQVIGQELARNIYAGRAIRPEDLARASRVERNQEVTLVYRTGGLTIRTEGRALDRGSVGAVVAVLNLGSRARVLGRVAEDGSVEVGGKLE